MASIFTSYDYWLVYFWDSTPGIVKQSEWEERIEDRGDVGESR